MFMSYFAYMQYFVYILFSQRDQKRYIGLTSNLGQRMREHSQGSVKSTRNRRPLKLIYFEKFVTKSEALYRENFFKSGRGRKFLKLIGLNKGE